MSDAKKQNRFQKRRLSDKEYLESWKAIANYLHRSVRTVRRWEGDEGLPVHRHQHSGGASVYAYRTELDGWRNSHRQSLQRKPAIEPTADKSPRFPGLAAYASVVVVAALVGVLVGKIAFEADAEQNSGIVAHEAWVLVAAPVNYDGLPEVGLNLREALIREISVAHRVLPLRRVQSALRLMRQDPKTTLTSEVARGVALRDGRVSALLVPRLEQLGDAYVLSVEIIDPNSDQLIAYPSEKISDLRAILPAVERLARYVETGLKLLADNPEAPGLPQVTTSSILALQLYSQADRYLNDNQPMVAQDLLDLALREDPKFAAARALQAWAMMRQGADKATYLQVSGAARDLSVQVTPAENFFIEGSYRHLSGDLVRAEVSYRTLLGIEPEHLFGAKALLELCLDSRSSGDCVDHAVQLATIRPEDFEFNVQAAWLLAAQAGSIELATHYADRALEIRANSDREFPPLSVARALIFPLISAWTEGDIKQATQKSRQLTDILPTLPIGAREMLTEYLVGYSTALGRISEAKSLLESISDSVVRQELRASFLFASGDSIGLKDYLSSDADFSKHETALLMALSGLPEEAMALHDDLRTQGMSNAKGAVIRASVAYGNGSLDTARSELQRAVVELTLDDQGFYFVAHDLLAVIQKESGQLADAIRVLERTIPGRSGAAFNNASLYWLMCQRQLAQLYRSAGRDDDATVIEKKIREMLLLADEDFPLLTSLDDV